MLNHLCTSAPEDKLKTIITIVVIAEEREREMNRSLLRILFLPFIGIKTSLPHNCSFNNRNTITGS